MKWSRRVKHRIADDLSFVRPISLGAGDWTTIWPSVDSHGEPINAPRGSITISAAHSTAWWDEPFSVERFHSNRYYRNFVLQHFDRRGIFQCLLRHEKACGRQYRREEAIKKIASIVRMEIETVRNLVNRSSRVVPKRRKLR